MRLPVRRIVFLGPIVMSLLIASFVFAQFEPEDEKPSAVKELFEDDPDFFIDNLHNDGAADGSIAERNERVFFSGTCSLMVSEFQRFNSQMPGWAFSIVEHPKPGQYRFLRFAWKRTEAPGIMLQLHAQPGVWHRYFAGNITKRTESWGAMTRVADDAPRAWEMVTRDLFLDFGPMTITGISFSALEGPGDAYFDHIYLGRTNEDLDRVTALKKAVSDPIAAASRSWNDVRWIIRAAALAGIAAALVVCLFATWRQSRRTSGADLPRPAMSPGETTPTEADAIGNIVDWDAASISRSAPKPPTSH
jgi:hypothetical protein